MDEHARRALEKLRENKEQKRTADELLPAIKDAASKSYTAIEKLLRSALAEINAQDLMKEAQVEVVIDGPWGYNYTNFYLLRLRGGKHYPDGSAFLIGVINTSQFDSMKVSVTVWQSHITMRGLQENLSGYVPGEEPIIMRNYSYKPVQAGSNFGWVKELSEDSDTLSTDDLIQKILSDLIVENLPDSQ